MSDCGVIAWVSCDWALARPTVEWLLRWSSSNAASIRICFEDQSLGVRDVVAKWLASHPCAGVDVQFASVAAGFANVVNRMVGERRHARYLIVVPPVVGELASLADILGEQGAHDAAVVAFSGKGFVHFSASIPEGTDVRFVARVLQGIEPQAGVHVQPPIAKLFDPFVFLVTRRSLEAAGGFDCLISDPTFCVSDFALRLARMSMRVFTSRQGCFVRPTGNTTSARVLERDRSILDGRWPEFAKARRETFEESEAVALQVGIEARALADPNSVPAAVLAGSRCIVAVLPTLTPYGGVLSVLNLLNHLFELGWHVRLFNLSAGQKTPVPTYFQPQTVTNWETLPEYPGGRADVVLATSWETVRPAMEILGRSPGAKIVHFVQDLEERFYPRRSARYAGAVASYSLIERKIVKTGYLQNELVLRGISARRIPPGMNLDAFFPRGRRDPVSPRVLAMCRVGHAHRGPDLVADCMRRILKARPGTEIGLFGSDRIGSFIRFPHRDFGLVSPGELPTIYSQHDVFVEMSRQHGFGRTGVEAMACGCAAVLSDSGGVREYARHGENALLVPVGDSKAAASAVLSLLDNASARGRLRQAGLESVQGYSDRAAALAFVEAALD